MLILLMVTGALLTIRTRGMQFRRFGYAMKNTVGKIFKKTSAGAGEMTPFQAMTTALALSGVVVRETKEHFAKLKQEKH